tara:strand:- start:1619 stop:2401 length:783 start_codon:yes stop_codon:yes gene_type:complete
MTIKQLGGVFGRNPTFNDVTIEGELTFDGDIDIKSDLKIDGDLEVTGTSKLTGNVGVGKSSGSNALEVQGESLFGSGTDGIKLTYSGGNGTGIIDTGYTSTGLEFRVGNVKKVTLNSSGNLEMNSGSGIDFSATAQAPGSTSELLDDYEEGVWTPAPAGGTLTINDATYTKVGRLVTAQADVTATATTSGDWSGLPFNLGGSLSADKQVGFVGYQSEESSAVWGVLADNTLATFTFRNGSTSKQLTTGSRAVFTIIYYTN